VSAYNRAELSVEAYLVRILAALCRQNGGEVRVKGELIDLIGESTCLVKAWDATKQELVISASMGMFTEVFRVIPERQVPRAVTPSAEVVDTAARIFTPQPKTNGPTADEFLPKGSTLDDERLAELERRRRVASAAALIRDELRRRRTQP
jgi:hypothetical protein